MMITKNISIDGCIVYLDFADNEIDPSEVKESDIFNLVEIEIIPRLHMTVSEGNNFLKKNHNYFLDEMLKVVDENKEFYDKFIVNRKFNAEGSVSINQGFRQILLSMDRSLDIKLK